MEERIASLSNNIWPTIFTILFALSLISERIANMIKLYSKNLIVKKDEELEEKKRERKIIWRALIAGWVVAFIDGADLFTLLKDGALLPYGSENYSLKPREVMGILLTGLFVSLGSKFWHDVLDIVLQFSALKKYQSRQVQNEIVQNSERSKDGKILDIIVREYPQFQKMKDFLEIRIRSGVPFFLFKTKPQSKDIAYLDLIFKGNSYSVSIAPSN